MNVYFLICIPFLFLSVSSLDTLSNYLDITLIELTGIFEPDFINKIVKGDLIYNFKSNVNGNQIILDSKKLNIISVSNIDNSKNYNFKYGEEDNIYGTSLIIEHEFKENEIIKLNIKYETTPEGKSAFFLHKNRTLGQNHDYFYAISSFAHGRELLPIQDTPAVKFVFNLGIKVNKDIRGMISGLFEKEIQNEDETKIFFYQQNIPVPNYLINLAAGNISEKQINEKITIYSEPELIDDAFNIFNDILPKILDEAISYIGPYEWEKFNLLFLPQSFPYSALEGPSLSFCSHFLLNGDQSSIDLIAGMIVASWAGNLVTHDNWRDLWISKGLLTFLQRKIISKIKGEDYAKMDSIMGLGYINENLDFYKDNTDFTTLSPNLTNTSIDDIISHIPSEKGYNFLYYIETLIGTDIMNIFIKNYFQHFKYKSINLEKFQDYFNEVCLNNHVSQKILDLINWDEWIYKPGKCPIDNDFSNNYASQTNELYEEFKNGNFDINNTFNLLPTNSKIVFIQKIFSRRQKLTSEETDFLTSTLQLDQSNFLIQANYFKLIIRKKYLITYDFREIENFLYVNTAIDYVTGIYFYYSKSARALAEDTFNNLKDFYHPIALDFFEKEIKRGEETYPFIELDFKKKITCLYYKDKIEITAGGYKDFLGNIETGNYIYLLNKYFNFGSRLNCYINSIDKYCLIDGDEITSDLYYIDVDRTIEEEDYAIVPNLGDNKIEIYKNKIEVDKNRTKDYYEFMFDTYGLDRISIYFITYDPSVKILLDNEELNCYRKNDDELILECYIDYYKFDYDQRDQEEYQKYEVKIIGECGIEKHSMIIKVRGPPDISYDKITIKISFWFIFSIIIAILLIISGFFSCFCFSNESKRLLLFNNSKNIKKI